MLIEIDPHAGFCFGVTRVVEMAEHILKHEGKLYCLGEVVHNRMEIERLQRMGLVIVSPEQFRELRHCKVLIRAHGEPPLTYTEAAERDIELIDGTCPIVLKIQRKIREDYNRHPDEQAQLAIFGKSGHAEVKGLWGQTGNTAILLQSLNDIDRIDFSRPVHLYAQTTMEKKAYMELYNEIVKRATAAGMHAESVHCNPTICAQVSNRFVNLAEFCKKHTHILFVSYAASSNGKMLFEQCRLVNDKVRFVERPSDLDLTWLSQAGSVGITGATSTPAWLMNEIASHCRSSFNNTPVGEQEK